jgi:hypothetical protein
MCKANYAHSVKGKMFLCAPPGADFRSIIHLYSFYLGTQSTRFEQKGLDSTPYKNIIVLTDVSFSTKTAAASSGRRAEPQSRRCHGRVVSAERVFRSCRFGAGQVRNAAASATRGTAGERSCPGLWLFPAFVLSGTSRFRRGGLGWFTSPQTRTKGWPQVDRRSDGFRQPDAGTGYVLILGRNRQAHSGAVSDFHSSAQYRSPVEPSKKTHLNVVEASDRSQRAELSSAYEQLRSQVLGVNGKPPRGPGLAVFLGRGMKAWIDAYRQWSACTATSKTARSPRSTTLCTPVENEVIVLLTGMLLERTVQEGR